MKNKVIKILNVVVDILVVLILLMSILVLTMVLSTKNKRGIPDIFGKAPITVQSESMDGDKPDSFKEGDLLLCDVVKEKDRGSAKYKVGDIITFKQDLNRDGVQEFVTHRVYKIDEQGRYLTKGDNNKLNPTYDQDPEGSNWRKLTSSEIYATYHGSKIGGFGKVLDTLQDKWGFFWFILFPMILFFLYQGVRVVINVIAYNKEKAIAKAQEAIANSDLTDEQKQKAIEEYLAAQKAKEAGADSAEAPEEKPEETPAAEAEETPAEEPAATEPEAKE